MRKIVILIILIASGFLPLYAKNLKGSVNSNIYLDYLEKINLTEKQRAQILKIKAEEESVLEPIVLEYTAKEEGLIFLDNLKCDMFDGKCKTRLKQDKELQKQEKNELMRQIKLKQNYYKIRYQNILTREQSYKIQKMAEEEAIKEKVLTERAKREKNKQRKEKMQFWKKVN